MHVFDISKTPLYLSNAWEDDYKSLTYLTIDYHHPTVESDKLSIVDTIVNMYKMLTKDGTVPYEDLISMMSNNHEPGDVDLRSFLLDDYFTDIINFYINTNTAKYAEVSIDSFVTDFKEIYHNNDYEPYVKDIFNKTINDFTNYIMMFKDLDWDMIKEEILKNMEITNPINNTQITSLPRIDIRSGVYLRKDLEIKALLKTKIVGYKLKTYFDKLRANNPYFDKLKYMDIYTYEFGTSKILRYQIEIVNDKYRIRECYSY